MKDVDFYAGFCRGFLAGSQVPLWAFVFFVVGLLIGRLF